MTNVEGLDRACARDNRIYIRNNNILVSGTKDLSQDHWDYISKIPFKLTSESLRYRNADNALTTNGALYPGQKNHVIGRSFVRRCCCFRFAVSIPRSNFQKTMAYGAPAKSTTIPDTVDNKRFRSIGDPVSI